MMQTAQALDSKCSCVTTSVRANGLRVLVRSSGMMRLSVDRTGEQGHKGHGFDQMPSTYQNHPRPKTFTNCVLKMRHYIIGPQNIHASIHAFSEYGCILSHIHSQRMPEIAIPNGRICEAWSSPQIFSADLSCPAMSCLHWAAKAAQRLTAQQRHGSGPQGTGR